MIKLPHTSQIIREATVEDIIKLKKEGRMAMFKNLTKT